MSQHVIKKAEIDAMEGLFKQHFLNPEAQRINKSLGDATGISGFGFHIIEVAPGKSSTEFHKHYYEDECIFVLSGTATLELDDETFEISAGDFVGLPAGGPAHAMVNTGNEVLKCIVVGNRYAHDVGDYPRQNKRLYRNAGQPWDMVDMEQLTHPVAGKKA